MQKIILWTMFLIIVGTCVNISVSSSSTGYNNLYQTSGGQTGSSTSSGTANGSVDLTVYVIVDGPGAGTQLYTTIDPTTGMTVAGLSNNQGTKADGHIGGIGVGEGMNCPGPLGHYHGTLNGQADPNPENCGWGHVSKYTDISSGLSSISQAISSESLIITNIEKEPPNYSLAADYASSAATELDDLRDTIRDPKETMIGTGKAKAISDKLSKAMKDDRSVLNLLKPPPPKRDTNIDTAVTLKINKALMIKQDAFKALSDAEAMAAAMGE